MPLVLHVYKIHKIFQANCRIGVETLTDTPTFHKSLYMPLLYKHHYDLIWRIMFSGFVNWTWKFLNKTMELILT